MWFSFHRHHLLRPWFSALVEGDEPKVHLPSSAHTSLSDDRMRILLPGVASISSTFAVLRPSSSCANDSWNQWRLRVAIIPRSCNRFYRYWQKRAARMHQWFTPESNVLGLLAFSNPGRLLRLSVSS